MHFPRLFQITRKIKNNLLRLKIARKDSQGNLHSPSGLGWEKTKKFETKACLAATSQNKPENTYRNTSLGSGQEVCFWPSRPDPGRIARDEDGTRTGRDGPHLGTWMGPKHCKTKHMANLDGTTSDSGWDLDGPRIGGDSGKGTGKKKGEAFLLTVGAFLLTVKLLYLQSLKALIRSTFPL